jgi:hypothetical protein
VSDGVDGTPRRFYPRIFTYSADYPEKWVVFWRSWYLWLIVDRVLLATIRDKGHCPCPRCLVLKTDIPKVGQKLDCRSRLSKARTYLRDTIQTARKFIYNLGLNVKGAAVERLLEAQSWVPTFVSQAVNISAWCYLSPD